MLWSLIFDLFIIIINLLMERTNKNCKLSLFKGFLTLFFIISIKSNACNNPYKVFYAGLGSATCYDCPDFPNC